MKAKVSKIDQNSLKLDDAASLTDLRSILAENLKTV